MLRLRQITFGLLTSFLAIGSMTVSPQARTRVSAQTFLHSTGQSGYARSFKLDDRLLEKALNSGTVEITDFPGADGELITLDLKPGRSAVDSTTVCLTNSEHGDIRVPIPQILYYRGKVLGEPHSRVSFCMMDRKLVCSILRESGVTYVLGPNKLGTDPTEHLLFIESDLLHSSKFAPFNCINDDLMQPKSLPLVDETLSEYRKAHSTSKSPTTVLGTTGLLQTDIAVEADTAFYGAAGRKLSTVLGYIGALFSMSSVYYEDETNITFHLSWIKVWTTSDPYNAKGNAYALPDTVKSYWLKNYDTVPRDLAHVMTSIGYGGGGYGWFSLCDKNWSYSVSSPQTGHQYPTFAFTYDSYIVAHEIGHNFSLPHSHTCFWNPPFDTCYTKNDPVHGLTLGDACDSLPTTPRPSPGTIMSYCANANYTLASNDFSKYKLELTFSPKADTVLRANAEKAACITAPATPRLILIAPRGSETFPSDSQIQITWTFSKITSIKLDFSSDGGTSWNAIAAGIPASQLQYAWKLPHVGSTQMLVRVQNETTPSVADTSLLFFTIVKQAVQSLISPLGSEYRLYPNPTNGVTTISSSIELGPVKIEIVNELGVVRLTFVGSLSPNQGIDCDLRALETGKYFVRITSFGSRDDRGAAATLPLILKR